jgi:hypothetical protein
MYDHYLGGKDNSGADPAPAVEISRSGIAILPRLLAVEVLLAEPEALDDDVLESCLYILREKLTGKTDE